MFLTFFRTLHIWYVHTISITLHHSTRDCRYDSSYVLILRMRYDIPERIETNAQNLTSPSSSLNTKTDYLHSIHANPKETSMSTKRTGQIRECNLLKYLKRYLVSSMGTEQHCYRPALRALTYTAIRGTRYIARASQAQKNKLVNLCALHSLLFLPDTKL